jgi:hypothetical protein
MRDTNQDSDRVPPKYRSMVLQPHFFFFQMALQSNEDLLLFNITALNYFTLFLNTRRISPVITRPPWNLVLNATAQLLFWEGDSRTVGRDIIPSVNEPQNPLTCSHEPSGLPCWIRCTPYLRNNNNNNNNNLLFRSRSTNLFMRQYFQLNFFH